MRRKGTKQSPAATAAERRFIQEVKQLPCIVCGKPGPSIYDHIWGSAKKLRIGPGGIVRVHVGHYAGLPLCTVCDTVKTQGSRAGFSSMFGSQPAMWLDMLGRHNLAVPEEVVEAMREAA